MSPAVSQILINVSRLMASLAQNRFKVAFEVNAASYQTFANLFHPFLRLAKSTVSKPCVDAFTESAILNLLNNTLFLCYI